MLIFDGLRNLFFSEKVAFDLSGGMRGSFLRVFAHAAGYAWWDAIAQKGVLVLLNGENAVEHGSCQCD